MAAVPSDTSSRWTIRDHPGLFEALRAEATTALAGVIKLSLDKVDSWLFDCLSKTPNFTPMLDAAKVLRARRGEFEQLYMHQVALGFEALQGCILPEPSLAAELSLVEEDELDGLLAAESMAASLELAHGADFNVVSRRLAVMAGRQSLRDAQNPLSPARLACSIQVAQRECPLPSAMRGTLFRTYERELSAALGPLLESIGSRLGQAGILPNLDRPPAPVIESEEEQGPPLAATAVYMPEATPGVDVSATYNAVVDLLHRRRPTDEPVQDLGGLELPDLRRPLEGYEIVTLLSQLQASVPESISTGLSDSGATLAELIKEEILHNLGRVGRVRDSTRLSQDQEDAIDLVGMLFGVLFEEREFADRSRQLLAQLVMPYVKAAVMDLRMFQFTTHPARMLLNALAESLEGNRGEGAHERSLQKQVEALVEHLVLGFRMSISIFPKLDKEFRDYLVRHRQRLDIAERRAAELQSGQERLENARARAESALADRVAGIALPARIDEFLGRYWSHHLAMVLLREGEDSAAWKHALAVGDHLLALLAVAPPTIRKTLAELNADLLAVLQSSGVTADGARQVLAGLTITLLERFVVPKSAPPATGPSAAAVAAPGGAGRSSTAPALAAVEAPLPARPVIVDDEPPIVSEQLVEWPSAADDIVLPTPLKRAALPARVAAASARSAPAGLAAGGEGRCGAAGFLDDDLDLVAIKALKLGDWVELVGDDDKTRPLKLSWVSPISQNMVFVNRHGVRVLVASPQELVALRHQRKLLMHSNRRLFDHAMHRIKDRLEAELARS